MSPTTDLVVGVFAHVDTTVKALEELRAKGYHDLEAYTPAPIHEIEDVMERDRPVSRVRLFTLIGALTGTVSGFVLTIWSTLQWGMVTGGKFMTNTPGGMPWDIVGSSIPPYVVIAFELTILFGGLSTVLGMVWLAGLPRFRQTPGYDPRFSNDRFGVAVRCAAGRGPSVADVLRRAGAEEVRA